MNQNDSLWRVTVGKLHLVAIAVLALATIGSNVLLWNTLSADPPVVHVRGTGAPRVVDVGKVPDALARDVAIDFLNSFENYSPETVERAAAFSRSRVAPGVRPAFKKLLQKRMELVRESGMVSQILFEDRANSRVLRSDDGPVIEVVVTAFRRIYIAGRLTESARLVYRVGLESAQPSRDNPTGLFVTGQSVRVASGKGVRREG